MSQLLKRIARFFVPVVASDIRKILIAVASKLPENSGRDLLRQIDYVLGRPVGADRVLEFKISENAPQLKNLDGVHMLANVEMCYYQQLMTFGVWVRNGYLYKIESHEPKPINGPSEEYRILKISVNDYALAALEKH